MKIAVASGKGGTGKTTVATSLALSLLKDPFTDHSIWFLDCDVEAPNAHLYLHPNLDGQQPAVILTPEVNPALCTACGKCVEVCQYHAMALIGKKVMVFSQLCHGCGSCTLNCPEKAITEVPRQIGMLGSGFTRDGIHFLQGLLTISEPMPTPVIRQLKHLDTFAASDAVILDSPPGASCSVVETLRKTDFVLLVTEPTPFGLHDLKQITGILHEMGIPAGVVINRDGIGDGAVDAYCASENLPILMRIPFDRAIAAGLSAGKPLVEIEPGFQERFQILYQQISTIVQGRL